MSERAAGSVENAATRDIHEFSMSGRDRLPYREVKEAGSCARAHKVTCLRHYNYEAVCAWELNMRINLSLPKEGIVFREKVSM